MTAAGITFWSRRLFCKFDYAYPYAPYCPILGTETLKNRPTVLLRDEGGDQGRCESIEISFTERYHVVLPVCNHRCH